MHKLSLNDQNKIKHKETVTSNIENAQNIHDIIPILKNVDLDKIKTWLMDTISASNTFYETYLSSQSIIDILSADVMQSIISFLKTEELCFITSVINKECNNLSKQVLGKINNALVCDSDVFYDMLDNFDQNYLYSENIQYYIQNRYELKLLKTTPFNQLGKILIGIDREVWYLCHCFKFEAALFVYAGGSHLGAHYIFPMGTFTKGRNGWWGDSCDRKNPEMEHFNYSYGERVEHATTFIRAGWGREYKMYPFIEITVSDVEWRKQFQSKIQESIDSD